MCGMFLLFAGCSAGGGSGSGSGGDQIDVLSGTKVLSRPSDYSFAEAVGEYSEYYYNLYAQAILEQLYNIYEAGQVTSERLTTEPTESDLNNGFIKIIGDNTYGNFTGNNQYYLYDSLRYTITKVDNIYDDASGTNLQGQIVYLDLNKSWDWKIKDDASIGEDNDGLYFETMSNGNNIVYSKDAMSNASTVTFATSEWLSTFDSYLIGGLEYPNFSSSYIGDAVIKQENGEDVIIGGVPVVNYYKSPYYQTAIEGAETATVNNYFQDAMEYAIYMFVLGYDYHTYDAEGNVIEGAINAEDAPYFEFDITYDANGYVSGMTVDGWGTDVPIAEALQIVKDRYAEIGGYVGVVEKNLEQLTRFIVEKVIGEDSPDEFTVEMDAYYDNNGSNIPTSTQPDDITFNRNYYAIANNIVRYACEQAPIGYTLDAEGNVQPLSLSNGFSASIITDYVGNYFFANYDVYSDGVYINDDSEIFANIEAAEYQSIVIYPCEELIGKTLGDLWFDFEYYELTDPTKTMLPELTLNVGFRYYDHLQNRIVVDEQQEMTITYGKNGTLKDENGEDISDQTLFMIGEGDGPYNVSIEEGSVTFREFNNAIGGGVLDPFVSGTVIDPSGIKASKYLSGTDEARSYYKLNDSQTSGQYGTLNEAKFAGECSFIEIYFDIVKDPTRTGVSYDFKVCLRTVTEHEDVDDIDIDEDFDEDDFEDL